ncbi:MAG: HD-GYP domain-containing protein [Planctomycetota bacterium]|jgi:HD-GYP domain-containing protein (c-di-GMP phosphodiesterase class II)
MSLVTSARPGTRGLSRSAGGSADVSVMPPPRRPSRPLIPDRRAAPRTDPVRTAHHDAIYTLARASELHDRDTGDHVIRIRIIVERIAVQMDFDDEDAEALAYDAMLHDVGKLRVPAEILRKPDGLTDDERELMQAHTVYGEQILSVRPSFARAAVIARSHHERFDGSGYPDGLSGEAIPLAARITAVADVLDALMSDRAYKRAWSWDRAMDQVCGLRRTQLDPEVIAALRRCAASGDLEDVWAG